MWTVSQDFLDSIPAGSRVVVTAELDTDGTITTLQVVTGSVSGQDQNVRRTFSGSFSHESLSAYELYDLVSFDAAILSVSVGFDWGGVTEVVPVFMGRISRASLSMSDAHVSVSAADFGYDLAQQKFFPALTQAASMTRRAAIAAIVADVFPGITVSDSATDTGTLLSEQTWTGSRWDAIKSLATDGNMECFFGPDGSFIIRDLPTIGTAVYLFKTHEGGTITGFDRERPLDKLFNAVVVKPATTDGSQTWTPVTAEITDVTSPRHKSRIGVRPLEISSSTATSIGASTIAGEKLLQVQGRTETVSLDSIANPALELGDTVQVVAQAWHEVPTVALTHLVDGFTFDINKWSMSLSTRNMGA